MGGQRVLQGSVMWLGGKAGNECASGKLLAVCLKDMEIEWLSFHQPGTLAQNGTMLLEPTSEMKWGERWGFPKSDCASHGSLSPTDLKGLGMEGVKRAISSLAYEEYHRLSSTQW